MQKRELVVGDVLQIDPNGRYKDLWGGMLIVCTEPKSWGCQGYLLASRNFEAVKFDGRAYLRPTWEDMEYIGKLQWMETTNEGE